MARLIGALTVCALALILLPCLAALGIAGAAAGAGVAFWVAYAVLWIASLAFLANADWFAVEFLRAPPPEPSDPTDVLRERYARGELTEAELETMLERVLDVGPRGGRSSHPRGTGGPARPRTEAEILRERDD
jgi:uncharacterized membrane protein